jgi:hypothetical protein
MDQNLIRTLSPEEQDQKSKECFLKALQAPPLGEVNKSDQKVDGLLSEFLQSCSSLGTNYCEVCENHSKKVTILNEEIMQEANTNSFPGDLITPPTEKAYLLRKLSFISQSTNYETDSACADSPRNEICSFKFKDEGSDSGGLKNDTSYVGPMEEAFVERKKEGKVKSPKNEPSYQKRNAPKAARANIVSTGKEFKKLKGYRYPHEVVQEAEEALLELDPNNKNTKGKDNGFVKAFVSKCETNAYLLDLGLYTLEKKIQAFHLGLKDHNKRVIGKVKRENVPHYLQSFQTLQHKLNRINLNSQFSL